MCVPLFSLCVPVSFPDFDLLLLHLLLDAVLQVAECDSVWGSALLNVNPVSSGFFSFSVKIASAETGCGVAVGVVACDSFDPTRHNIGVHAGTWAYSKTGKKGRDGYVEYSESYFTGDTITVEADMDAGTLRYGGLLPFNRCCCRVWTLFTAARFAANSFEPTRFHHDTPDHLPTIYLLPLLCVNRLLGKCLAAGAACWLLQLVVCFGSGAIQSGF